MCLIDTDPERSSLSPWSNGLRSLTSPRTAGSELGLLHSLKMERLLHKFAGKKNIGSDRRQSSNRGFATESGLRSVTSELDTTNPNKKCHIFVIKLCSYRIHAFQAMSKLVILFFFFHTKLSLKSLQETLSQNENPPKSVLFNKERDANTALQFLYVFRMQYLR